VEYGAVLGAVDLLALEHGLDPLPQAGFLRELKQQLNRVAGDAILRVIEIDAHRFSGQAFAALTVLREQISQMQCASLLSVRLEALPRWPVRKPRFGKWIYNCRHILAPLFAEF
jgi:hypothetical protein